ncbi:glycoside hydrolase family 108 protein [Flavobacterium capsici]|uniref:Glycosyl hydrolase 108 family protein n=1 Tax=Flavobacterium capsici TaxID=3075618 RepID=A0AA96F2C9_9FLAO|nr:MULTISPECIES: glycosyl hydrolase 108 family protein [unclassified Flavobacterium]WNM18606.1 glycosyl hydrolase 108 family protein [Flavobacterium sp. PMR2A8]WNM22657.1 glycosyl hydrolase 108 family protein [Flavobacterium sp. PMTSA4]
MNKQRFQLIFSKTLFWEGGEKLHKVADDAGGYTKYGIAYNFNKSHFQSLDEFKKMTLEKASEIAYFNYCVPIKLQLVKEDCQAMLFDMAFNMGVKTAIKCAQRALKLKADGIIGEKTKAALKNLDKETLYYQRMMVYQKIVDKNETQKKFFKGWKNRADYFLETSI